MDSFKFSSIVCSSYLSGQNILSKLTVASFWKYHQTVRASDSLGQFHCFTINLVFPTNQIPNVMKKSPQRSIRQCAHMYICL